MMYCVSFNSSEVFGYSVIVALTETDSEATFQHFLEDAYCSFQDYVVNWALTNLFSSLNDTADDDEIEERLEKIREECYLESVEEIRDTKPFTNCEIYTTDDGFNIDW